MKSLLTGTPLSPVRLGLAAGAIVLLVAAVLPPFLDAAWRDVVMATLAPLCHQLPERSFELAGTQLGLCHRCTALLSGMAVALCLPLALRNSIWPLLALGVALAPAALDWGLEIVGIWANTTASRVITGAWAGLVLGFLVGASAGPSSRRSASQGEAP